MPATHRSSGSAEFDARIRELVKEWGVQHSPELIEELIVTALKIGHDRLNVADLKLFNRALKEMRSAARLFAPYTRHPKVVVFGSARTPANHPESKAAEAFARKMVKHDYMIITGGGDGIMGAAQKGAGRAHSFGLNIRLPFEQRANETIHGDPKLLNFNYFFTRKLNFLKETHAVALFPGGFGTMDEGFEVLTLMQTGKARLIPLVFIDGPHGHYWKTWFDFLRRYLLKAGMVGEEDFNLFKITNDLDEAVGEILKFYSTFHSYRYVGDRLVIRLRRKLVPAALERLNRDFSDLHEGGAIVQSVALPQEKNEPELLDLPRLLMTWHRRSYGRLRQLLDAINASETLV